MTPVVVLVTDPRYDLAETRRIIGATAAALGPNRLLVQLRDKEASEAALLESARVLRAVTRQAAALLIINGSPAASLSVAKAVGADGLHLAGGERGSLAARVAAVRARLGDEAFVTTAAHDDDDVRAASEAFASAALVSPIFATPDKGPPRGVAALTAARAIIDAARRTPRMLVYALGGVTAANAAACAEAGADGVAVIRALYEARTPSDSGNAEGRDARSLGAPFR